MTFPSLLFSFLAWNFIHFFLISLILVTREERRKGGEIQADRSLDSPCSVGSTQIPEVWMFPESVRTQVSDGELREETQVTDASSPHRPDSSTLLGSCHTWVVLRRPGAAPPWPRDLGWAGGERTAQQPRGKVPAPVTTVLLKVSCLPGRCTWLFALQ